ASGVSRQVVSYILNADEKKAAHFSPDTKERVLATAEKIGYRRNRAALNFTQNRQGSFDLVMKSFYAGNAQMMAGLTQTAQQHDQVINITVPSSDNNDLRCLHENSCDAVLLVANTNAELDQKLEQISSPVVRINCNVQDRIGCINFDEAQGMELLVERFTQRGRTHLCFIHGDSDHFSSTAREEEGIHNAAQKSQNILWHKCIIDKQTDITEHIKEHLEQQPEIDAIIIAERSLPQLYAALRMLGRKPGEDISVLCINAHIVAQAVFPSCAGIQIQQFNIGKIAVEYAMELLNGEKPHAQYLNYDFIDGDSL
ncbi:MAG: LacI family DNA-binding transcriptional regulator, partial [Planctomycetes bacterium]|nr:LacI family DNA-binding transcriptional regulator [Planctomycetota bacterium]